MLEKNKKLRGTFNMFLLPVFFYKKKTPPVSCFTVALLTEVWLMVTILDRKVYKKMQ